MVRRWCHTAIAENAPTEQTAALLTNADWNHAGELLACPIYRTPTVSAAIWSRIFAQPTSFLEYANRKDGWGCGLLLFAVEGRDATKPLTSREAGTLGDLLSIGPRMEACVAQALQSVAPNSQLTRMLLRISGSKDVLVADNATETLARTLSDRDPDWPRVVQRATEIGLIRSLHAFDRSDGEPSLPAPESVGIGDESDIIVTGSRIRGRGGLPPFPWPPPKYASRATFGVDIPRSLLGPETETLEVAYERLIAALASIDPQYSSGLFGASGGFVLLTRMEQTDDAGKAVAKPYRWRAYQRPPVTMSDYLVRLFMAPPGHYRTLAFVFTNETDLAPGTGAVPDIDVGNTVLPDAVGGRLFNSVHVYVLVYAYTKKDTDQVLRVWRDLSGKEHLDRAQILTALQH